MELYRVAGEIMGIREQMDHLIEKYGETKNTRIAILLARKLLELKRRKDALVEQA